MSRRTFKLSHRHDEEETPANDLALAIAFAFLGLTNTFLNMIPGGIGALLSLCGRCRLKAHAQRSAYPA